MNMKVSMAAFAIFLIAAFCSMASSAPIGSDSPTACCFSYPARQIPRSFVRDYYETNSMCSQPGVVVGLTNGSFQTREQKLPETPPIARFLTKKGREICANPNDSWVQEYMNDLELN